MIFEHHSMFYYHGTKPEEFEAVVRWTLMSPGYPEHGIDPTYAVSVEVSNGAVQSR